MEKYLRLLARTVFSRFSQDWPLIFIVTSAFIVLGVPFRRLGFHLDDFAFIWRGQMTSLRDFIGFFQDSSMYNILHGDNWVPVMPGIFSAIYRPLLFAFFAVQHKIFGFQAYGYHLVFCLFHGINGALFFLILRRWVKQGVAFVGSLYFLFHPSFLDWFSDVSNQQHIMGLFFVLLAILIYQKEWVGEKSAYKAMLIGGLVCITTFFRETFLVLPVWFLFVVLFYRRSIKNSTLLGITLAMSSVAAWSWRIYKFPWRPTECDLTTLTKQSFSIGSYIQDLRVISIGLS